MVCIESHLIQTELFDYIYQGIAIFRTDGCFTADCLCAEDPACRHFEQQLHAVPFLHVMPTQANYFLCEVLPPYTAKEIVINMLKQHNILTRDCSGKPGLNPNKQYMRIAVRNHEDNTRLVEALKDMKR